MTTIYGNDGVVEIGADPVGKVRNWTADETSDTGEDSAMGSRDRSFAPGMKQWTAQVVMWFDDGDAGQAAMIVNTVVALTLQPAGATVGNAQLTGQAIITGLSQPVPFDGFVELTASFQGTGALDRTPVPV